MMANRRFPPPLSIEELNDAYFIVKGSARRRFCAVIHFQFQF